MNISPKATRTEITLICVTGLLQGLALVTFPVDAGPITRVDYTAARFVASFGGNSPHSCRFKKNFESVTSLGP